MLTLQQDIKINIKVIFIKNIYLVTAFFEFLTFTKFFVITKKDKTTLIQLTVLLYFILVY